MRERETVRHVCAYDISKCNPSGGRLDPTKLDGFDECVYCGFDGVLCDASPYIEWGFQFKNMTEEETLAAEDYCQWLKEWAKTKGWNEMSNEKQETIADIVADIRAQNQGLPEDDYALSPLVADLLSFADRIEAAHKREIADEKRISDAVVQSLRDKKLEMAGEIAAKEAEIAELRECLREAVREKCPFTRMSCKHGEPCDYECGTFKWRKALKGSNNATK